MTSTYAVDYSNLTSENYKQFLGESVVEKIESYLEENFFIDDMIAFIQEYGDTAFCNHYDEYVEAGESNSYNEYSAFRARDFEAADAFIEEFGVDYLSGFEDAYRGEWDSKADYAENFVSDCYCLDIPIFVEVDWEKTFNNLGCVYSNGFVFDTQF
jgi:hypothetical protein